MRSSAQHGGGKEPINQRFEEKVSIINSEFAAKFRSDALGGSLAGRQAGRQASIYASERCSLARAHP